MWESWKLFIVQNLDQLHILVSSAHKTTCHDMTCTVLKVTTPPPPPPQKKYSSSYNSSQCVYHFPCTKVSSIYSKVCQFGYRLVFLKRPLNENALLYIASMRKKLKSYLYTKAYPPYSKYPLVAFAMLTPLCPWILIFWLTILVMLHLGIPL